MPLRSTRLCPSGLNGSGKTSAALPRVQAGNRSPISESPNQELAVVTRSHPQSARLLTVVILKVLPCERHTAEARSERLSSLPIGLRGMAATKRTSFGHLYPASELRHHAASASARR